MLGGGRTCRRTQHGAAALELAFITPVLLLLVFGMVSYGYMLSFRQAMSQGAAEGARAAAVAPPQLTDSDVAIRAREAINAALDSYGVTCDAAGFLMRAGVNAGSCTVSAPQACSGSTTGAMCVRVTLTYNYQANPLTPKVPGVGLVMPEALSFTTEAQVS